MGRWTPFAEVLEEKLGVAEPPPPLSPVTGFDHRATVHAFLEFTAASKPVSSWHPRHPYAAPDGPTDPPQQQPTPAERRLSRQEREALDQLNTLGAAISPYFTAEELRSAFRALALTFHPDRHHRSTRAEAASLSRDFIALHEAYRTLQTVAPAAA